MIGLLVLVSACKKETTPVAATQSGSKILVTGQDAGTGLKSTLSGQSTVWIQTSDIVGIYSAAARDATGGGGSAIVNAPFTAAASTASSVFNGTMYWGAAAPTAHTFYAYYPYTAGSAASTAVPVSLATAQTQSAANNSDHIGALDFMVATPVTVNSPGIAQISNTAVHLSYNHLFTILEFQIKGTGLLKAVSLSTSNLIAFSGGAIDIAQPTPATDAPYIATKTGTTTQATVTLTSPATLDASNTNTIVYMVINPGTQTGNCAIGLSADGSTWKYITKTALSGGFLRGKKYVVSVDAATALSIGDSYQGGKIFYFLKSGDPGYVSGEIHGLIAATADQSTGIQWAVTTNQNTSVPAPGATGTVIGTGLTNTNAIVTQNVAGNTYAAGLCDAYTNTDTGTGVYSDWYLPSKDELNQLFINRVAVGGIASAYYWSSSEYNYGSAWFQNFLYVSQSSLNKSFPESYVRAIRAF
jgi:hypothetical protein